MRLIVHSLRYGVLAILMLYASISQAVTLAWDYTQGADPATQFNVYRDDNCVNRFVIIQMVGVNTQQVTDNSVQPGINYCYVVTAQDSQGKESAPSNMVQIFLSPQESTPSVPTNLRKVN